jgi:hypothetical protein
MTAARRKPYTEAELAVDLALQVNRLVERNTVLESAYDAAKRMAARPNSAHAAYDFAQAAAKLDGSPSAQAVAR